MRVVTFDWTRLSLAAARTTPPSSTTVRNILRDSRSIVLMQRTLDQINSFVQALAAHQNWCMATDATTPGRLSIAATCFVAISALAVAMGIGRFAFTPMLPLMVRDGAISQDAGAPLAASNYLGYLVGALVAGRLRLSSPSLMVSSLIGTAAVTAATGAVAGLAAWLSLRFAAGMLSAWTLVATSTWVLHELTKAQRTQLAGLVYSGVGLGIAIAGAFCVVAARPGVAAHDLWVDLGGLAAILVAGPVLWLGWGSGAERVAVVRLRPRRAHVRATSRATQRASSSATGCSASATSCQPPFCPHLPARWWTIPQCSASRGPSSGLRRRCPPSWWPRSSIA